MSDIGTVFPPRSANDVFFYDDQDIVEGYRDFQVGDPEPGANRSPGYRWGWSNARYDHTGNDGGFGRIRSDYIRQFRVNLGKGREVHA